MISRHHLVEIKCVKELPLSTLSLPHHGLLPRIAVSVRRNHGSPTVSTRVLQHNPPKADKRTIASICPLRADRVITRCSRLAPVSPGVLKSLVSCQLARTAQIGSSRHGPPSGGGEEIPCRQIFDNPNPL